MRKKTSIKDFDFDQDVCLIYLVVAVMDLYYNFVIASKIFPDNCVFEDSARNIKELFHIQWHSKLIVHVIEK